MVAVMVVNSSKVGPGPWDSFDETLWLPLLIIADRQISSFKCEVSVEGHGSRTKGAETTTISEFLISRTSFCVHGNVELSENIGKPYRSALPAAF